MVLTTKKLELCLPSLKSAFSNDLKSRTVFKLSCSGCIFTYVGQTVPHLATRIEGNSADLSWEIRDRSNNQTKLLSIEAIDIKKEKSYLNTRDEFRSRKITLKIYSQYSFDFSFKTYMSKSTL